MYKLPANFDPSFFLNRTLELVCFSQTTAYLHFEKEITISVSSSYSCCVKDEENLIISQLPVQESNLMSIVGFKVVAADADIDGTLMLEFDNSYVFHCYDNLVNFESYEIEHDGKRIIV